MEKKEDKDTRYFIDVDMKTQTILNWDYGQREILVAQKLSAPFHLRIFITRGQYSKLVKMHSNLENIFPVHQNVDNFHQCQE